MPETPVSTAPPHDYLDRLGGLIGRECALQEVTQTLHFLANALHPNGVGAIQVTCADESENECVEAFQNGFVHYLLPPLKFAHRSAMRLANLGSQYEWSAIRIAEQHYASPESRQGFKLIVVKINSHVAAESSKTPGPIPAGGDGHRPPPRIGFLRRYQVESPCCGALSALLSGSRESFTDRLRDVLNSEGLHRETLLLNPSKVDPDLRLLVAAVASVRLQARKAVLDIQDYSPVTPTYWLVVPCVTLNRSGRDTEIVCGRYTVDTRGGRAATTYQGLGDDPSLYEIRHTTHGFIVEDEEIHRVRPGRDHRAVARERWQQLDTPAIANEERLERIRRDVQADKHLDHRHAKTLLRMALPLLAELAPVPAALLLFAEGAVSIRHAFRVQRLTHELEGSEDARRILKDIERQVDQLDPDRAEALIELLVKEHSS